MIGRLLGWTLVALSLLTASAEAVMALAPAPHNGIAAGEVWTLLSGRTPFAEPAGLLTAAGAWIMELPAWIVMGPLGVALLVMFRKRRKRHIFRDHRRHVFG